MLLGPPGQGKSFLAEMTASRLATEAILRLDQRDNPASLDEVPLPLPLSLTSLRDQFPKAGRISETQVQDAILAVLNERFVALANETKSYLRKHLTDANVWLFLDGLDEVDQAAPGLRAVLQFTANVQGRVLVGGRPYGLTDHIETLRVSLFGLSAAAGQIPESVKAYRLAPFDPGQIKSFTGQWFDNADDVPIAFQKLLGGSPSVRLLARIPFLLSLLCAVAVDSADQIGEEVTRSELYELALKMLFAVPRPRWFDKLRYGKWRGFLARMSLWLIGRDENAVRRPHIRGEQELEALLARKTLHTAPTPLNRNLEGDWEQASINLREELLDQLQDGGRMRLLVRDRVDKGVIHYVFAPRSFAEYLAGWCLAELANTDDGTNLDRELPLWLGEWLGGQKLRDVFDKLSWRADWHEVIKFAAGQLSNPAELLRLLADLTDEDTPRDPGKDDVFRHRLALAAECLPAIRSKVCEELPGPTEAITCSLMDCIEAAEKNDTSKAFPHLARLPRPCSGRSSGWETDSSIG